jgi:hypothetical protein
MDNCNSSAIVVPLLSCMRFSVLALGGQEK